MIRLELNPDKAWVIRLGKLGAEEPYQYFMAHSTWTFSVLDATIFRDYDAADKECYRARYELKFVKDKEVIEVVPLEGALIRVAQKLQQRKQ